jgi:hypothetical protein
MKIDWEALELMVGATGIILFGMALVIWQTP